MISLTEIYGRAAEEAVINEYGATSGMSAQPPATELAQWDRDLTLLFEATNVISAAEAAVRIGAVRGYPFPRLAGVILRWAQGVGLVRYDPSDLAPKWWLLRQGPTFIPRKSSDAIDVREVGDQLGRRLGELITREVALRSRVRQKKLASATAALRHHLGRLPGDFAIPHVVLRFDIALTAAELSASAGDLVGDSPVWRAVEMSWLVERLADESPLDDFEIAESDLQALSVDT